MPALSFKTKIWLLVATFSTITLILGFTLLSAVYYTYSINSFKAQLSESTKEILEDHLVFDNNQIFFKRDNNNQTIGAYLRDKNMSAVFYDKNNDSLAEYGVYQKMVDENKIDQIFENSDTDFFEANYYPNDEYFVLRTPILFDNSQVGTIKLAVSTPFFQSLKKTGWAILSVIVIFFLVLSWPISRWLVSLLLRPLENLVETMETVKINGMTLPIDNPRVRDEISVLIESYNKLMMRIHDGFDRQKAFISHASHELKTPLARVISSLEVYLLDHKDNQIEKIKLELFQFSKLIDELLILSKIDTNPDVLARERVNIAKVVNNSLFKLSNDIKQKNISTNVIGSENISVVGSEHYVEIILDNVISNAIKYSQQNGKVDVNILREGDNVSVVVQDFGVGISQADLPRIFDRFFRSKNVGKTNGFGIGLALVKQICQIFQIEIKYESEVGVGTRVTLSNLKATG